MNSKIIEIKSGGTYSIYNDLVYRATGLGTASSLNFNVEINGDAIYTSKIPIFSGVATLQLNAALSVLKTTENVLFSKTTFGAKSPASVVLSYTTGGTTYTVPFFAVNTLVAPETALYGNNFLSPIRTIIYDKNFETGVWFFGAKTVYMTDTLGNVRTVTGNASQFNFLSFRNVWPSLLSGLEVAELATVQIGDGDPISVEKPILDRYDKMVLKFQGLAGGYQYFLFYEKKSVKPKSEGGELHEFQDGQYKVGGSLALDFVLYRDNFPIADIGLLTELSQAQNAFLAPYWQFSPFDVVLSLRASDSTSRLVSFVPTAAQYAELVRVFAVQDAVRFELVAQPYTLLGMWGSIVQLSAAAVVFRFESQFDNNDLGTLDAWLSGSNAVRIVREFAWYAGTVEPIYETGGDAPLVPISVKFTSNKFQKYNI